MIRIATLPLAALTAVTPALAAERSYTVTTFDRVRVDGPFAVTLTTGRSPAARASGSPQAIDRVSIEVQGRTLTVRPNRSAWSGSPQVGAGPVRIALATHELAAAQVNGSGSLEVDKVRGLAFEAAVQGSGSLEITEVAVDRLSARIGGSGSMSAAGKALRASALVRGSGTLDGAKLTVRDATVSAAGPATVRLNVVNAAEVSALGTAQVGLTGGPACTVKASGSATVEGCR